MRAVYLLPLLTYLLAVLIQTLVLIPRGGAHPSAESSATDCSQSPSLRIGFLAWLVHAIAHRCRRARQRSSARDNCPLSRGHEGNWQESHSDRFKRAKGRGADASDERAASAANSPPENAVRAPMANVVWTHALETAADPTRAQYHLSLLATAGAGEFPSPSGRGTGPNLDRSAKRLGGIEARC